MIRKRYEATLHDDWSAFGVDLEIAVPESKLPVIVAQDVFGELEERMQLLVYPPHEDPEVEESVSIRFNQDGTIAEVRLPKGVNAYAWNTPELSPWLQERDGV